MLYSLLSASAILLGAVQAQTVTPGVTGTTAAATTQAPVAGTGTVPVASTTTSVPVVSIPNPPSNVPPVTQTPPTQVTPQQPSQMPPYSFFNPYAQIPPVQQPPVIQTPPTQVTPQQPPATPQYGYPYGQQFNPYFGGMVDPQNLNCEFGQCRNRRITLSPTQGFQLNCQQPRQCDGLDLTLNVGYDPTNFGSGVSEINDLNFDSMQNGVTIRINSLTGNNVEVNNLKCQQIGSCNNLKILAGFGVEVWNINVHCEMPGACNGCTINGQSCAMLSMMNGNNNGFMPYGFGYQNTANIPGQPQQPQSGYGAPQYPQYQPYQQYPQYPPYGFI